MVTKFIIIKEGESIILGYKRESIMEQGYIYAPYVPRLMPVMMYKVSRWKRLCRWFKFLFKGNPYSKKSVNPSYYSKILVNNIPEK